MDFQNLKGFYKGKRIFITGHTGFKGSWMCMLLNELGADVYGYSLKPSTDPSLYEKIKLDEIVHSTIGDVRDYDSMEKTYKEARPDVVFHLAAQPIVRDSYKDPRYTYETNVMGTVNILECLRRNPGAVSFLNVTTDKVYENNDVPDHAFTEDEKLDGYDPYSNSKSCSELVTHCYKKSFFQDNRCMISTARAGNVIGGGDFATDRIIPDCIRAIENKTTIKVRNPLSTRPYQHVLEPLYIYLRIVEEQFFDASKQGYYNVGPDDCDCVNTGDLVAKFCCVWGNGLKWVSEHDIGPHEAAFLKLNNSKIKEVFGWSPRWHIDECINKIVEWTKVFFLNKDDVPREMDREIEEFFGGIN